MGKGRGANRGRGRSLNLMLWFTFTAFALVLVILYALLQNVLVRRQFRENTAEYLAAAGEEIVEIVSSETALGSDAAGSRVLSVANEYAVSVYVLYQSGESVYAPFGETQSYPNLAKSLAENLSDGSPQRLVSDEFIAYAATVEVGGETCFVFVAQSVEGIAGLGSGLLWLSFITAFFAVVLAFSMSGILAALITKPVTDLTRRARALANGNYDLTFKDDYYCSEIGELSEALERARREISKASAVQRELIANVSHDFKTPLTMIKAYASMIREISGADEEKRNLHAKIIEDEADRLTALVGDVLDLSKLTAGIGTDERTVYNFSEDVYRVAGRFDYLVETQGYQIEREIEDDIYVQADRERISQVLYNLIGNAVNYTGEDKRVRVRLFRTESGCRFEVVDSGKGIPPEETETIWDRYYRSSGTHKRPVQGTGLGLSIVKSILLAQECPFGIVSEVGKGSCFWVEFPSPGEQKRGKHREEKGDKA